MEVFIDHSKDEVWVKDEEGNVKKATIVKSKPKKDPSAKTKDDTISDRDSEISLLNARLNWLKSKVSTLSIADWEAYKRIGE